MRKVLYGLLIAAGPLLAQQQAPPTCVSCQKPVNGRYHWADTPAFVERQALCDPCNNAETRCSECQLPVRTGSQQLKDGRILCPRHARIAVLDPRQAQTIFRDAQRGVIQLLRDQGKLPEDNIEVRLIDQNQMKALLKDQSPTADSTRGVTETTRNPAGSFTHQISLLNGLTPNHTLAVAAHEYTHAWLAENVTRTLNPNTVEGFCELVAYKVVTARNLAIEQKSILANAYSQGQLDSLRKAADDYRFYEVVNWIKTGKDEAMDKDNTATVFALHRKQPALHNLPSSSRTQVPDQLTLKGISGGAQRRFALVNDCTLEKNERGRVRVGESNVAVLCLDITANSVLLEVLDSKKRLWLTLREPKAIH